MRIRGLKKALDSYCRILNTRYRYGQEPYPQQLTDKTQITVYDERYALAKFKQSNLVDCRISGYPLYTEYKEVVRHTPAFLFIDLDLDNFVPFGSWSSKRLLDMALQNTLRKIKQTFGKNVEPTVLWTGNGYHIYLPIQPLPIPLESDTMFSMFSSPSQSFIRFLEWYLSDGKCDPVHNPTFLHKLHGKNPMVI